MITYCTGGVRSAEAWTMLRALGYADVRNYDGSWFEWSADNPVRWNLRRALTRPRPAIRPPGRLLRASASRFASVRRA